jgi:hypothetical protein
MRSGAQGLTMEAMPMLFRTALISATLLFPYLAGISALLRKDAASSRASMLSGKKPPGSIFTTRPSSGVARRRRLG